MKANLRLIAVDLLGFGKSPKPTACLYTLEEHLEQIEGSVLKPFQLKSFHLVAHSMGCIIAIAFAARHPELVQSITLIAPVSYLRHKYRSLDFIILNYLFQITQVFLTIFCAHHFYSHTSPQLNWQQAMLLWINWLKEKFGHRYYLHHRLCHGMNIWVELSAFWYAEIIWYGSGLSKWLLEKGHNLTPTSLEFFFFFSFFPRSLRTLLSCKQNTHGFLHLFQGSTLHDYRFYQAYSSFGLAYDAQCRMRWSQVTE